MILNMYNIQLRSNQATNQHTSFHLISRHIPMYPLPGVAKAPLQPPPTVGETFRCLKRSRISKGICRRTSWFAAPRSSVLQLIMVLDDQGG